MRANQAIFHVVTMCRVLGVSTRGFYRWRSREVSERGRVDAELTKRIEVIHDQSRRTYGAPRIHAELREDGTRVGRKRVARLMRQAGIAGVSRRKAFRTTRRDDRQRPAPDLVDRQFTADGPNQLWVAESRTFRRWLASCSSPSFSTSGGERSSAGR